MKLQPWMVPAWMMSHLRRGHLGRVKCSDFQAPMPDLCLILSYFRLAEIKIPELQSMDGCSTPLKIDMQDETIQIPRIDQL